MGINIYKIISLNIFTRLKKNNNVSPSYVAKKLMDKYRIFTVAIGCENVKVYWISIKIFTTPGELDIFVNEVK